ncbi:hypothetical protein [Clostridium thermarum]|uniref:hypothetical protein n=1 Tax=Clostridium thermarum TaxID=1716543 RepID=UPI00111E899C|nr:hypothetical protein [Clostridium thermarum]
MFVLFLLATGVAVGEYFYFGYKMEAQRRSILLLTKQNEKLRSKASKQVNTFSSVNITYHIPTYRNGYTTDNCYILLSPLENSPVVFQCSKTIKASILDSAEILNSRWYFISIPSTNNNVIKGWLKESDIKFVVDESTTT